MRIIKNGERYDYFVNVDNIYLLNEIKKNNNTLIEATQIKFIYGMYLLSLSINKNHEMFKDLKIDQETIVSSYTSAAAMVIIPIIEHLSQLEI